MKTLVIFADGVEPLEAVTIVDVLRRADVSVTTVSLTNSVSVRAAHKMILTADTLWPADLDVFEAIILPGGGKGTENLNANEIVKNIVSAAYKRGAFVAAICAAPSILGRLGILNGKEAICYPGFEKYLTGAKISDEKVVQDGNVITAKGMGVSLQFGLKLIEILKGIETANKIKESVMA